MLFVSHDVNTSLFDDVCRDIYDKMRADLRLSKEEAQRIETSRAPKVNVTSIDCFRVLSLFA